MQGKRVYEKGTLELETLGFSPIREPNDVVRVGDGTENVLLLPVGIVGNDAGLQLGELVGSTSNSDEDGGFFSLVRGLEDFVDGGFALFEGRLEADKGVGGVSDPKLFDDVTGLKHVTGPLVGFGTSPQTLYG